MTVKIRQYKRGGFEVDIRFTYPDGSPFRRRIKAPVESRSAAKRWGEAREVDLLTRPSPAAVRKADAERKEVPTLEKFQERFIAEYAKANRQKASGIASKERILRIHLLPRLGGKPLDRITTQDIQALKGDLAKMNPKTVNNVLTVLGKLLKVAVEWEVIERVPCSIKLLKLITPERHFYEFEDYARLVEAAAKCGARVHLMVRLAGDAGLRRGEIAALRWPDVDLRRGILNVQRAEWNGIVDMPKSGRGRIIPLTKALGAVLQAHRHLRSERVLCHDDGSAVDAGDLQHWIEQATRRAGLAPSRSLHILRHTFCSHLAMRGAPAKAIQELAGHLSLSTTLRYMHLSPAARESAIRLLDLPLASCDAAAHGEIVETVVG
jgi:integrase